MKLLKFYATWCGPCKGLTMTLNGMDNLPVALEEIDIDQNMDMARKYNVRSVPTLVLVNEDGTEVNRGVGMLSEQQILELVGA